MNRLLLALLLALPLAGCDSATDDTQGEFVVTATGDVNAVIEVQSRRQGEAYHYVGPSLPDGSARSDQFTVELNALASREGGLDLRFAWAPGEVPPPPGTYTLIGVGDYDPLIELPSAFVALDTRLDDGTRTYRLDVRSGTFTLDAVGEEVEGRFSFDAADGTTEVRVSGSFRAVAPPSP